MPVDPIAVYAAAEDLVGLHTDDLPEVEVGAGAAFASAVILVMAVVMVALILGGRALA